MSTDAGKVKDPNCSPWTTLDSTIVYRNPWISVREDRVIGPDGKEGIYGVVQSKIATAALAISPQDEVYLVGQFRYPTNQYSWEVIEGGADQGETALAAAQRELEEEAGIRAVKWTQLGGEIHLSNCFTAEVAYAFLAEDLTFVEPKPDSTEVLQVRRLPLGKCLELVDSGEIKDALSIITLLRYERMRRSFGGA